MKPKYTNWTAFLLFICALISSCVQTTSKRQEGADKISYKIESKDLGNKPIKASFDIRIDKKLSKEEITEIANGLIEEHQGFDRYFIFYWLPDMEIGKGVSWATSHFADNSLIVDIQGASREEEDKMKAAVIPEGEIIGKWYDSRPYVESTIIIYKDAKSLKVRQIYKDGSFGDKTLEKRSNTIYVYPNSSGEFFKIENDGSLGWYSNNGKFASAKKIE